jgi:hypothetical protein
MTSSSSDVSEIKSAAPGTTSATSFEPLKVSGRASRLAFWGVVGSVVDVAAIGRFLSPWSWNDLIKLEMNEVGDFLAGVVGPLALGWPIPGFFQQERGLRLQGADIRNFLSTSSRSPMRREATESID